MSVFNRRKGSWVLGMGLVIGLCGGTMEGAILLWEVNHQAGGVEVGAQVNSGTNAWWNSSSPMTRFVADEGEISVVLEPGHELSNLGGIAVGEGLGFGVLELLVRSEGAITLGLAANRGVFSLLGGPEGEGTLTVPGIEAVGYR